MCSICATRFSTGARSTRPRVCTYDWYRGDLESLAQTRPADLTVGRLKPFHVQQRLDAHPRWKTGKRGAVVAVQRALNWAAVRMGLITENPIRGIEKPKAGRRELVITAGQFHDIVSVIKDTEFRDLLTLRWETAAG